MITTAPLIRRFVVYQNSEMIYQGVRFDDGHCFYQHANSSGWGFIHARVPISDYFRNLRDVQILWLDSEEPQRPACIHCGGGYLDNHCIDCGASGTTFTLPVSLADDIVKWRRDSIKLDNATTKKKRKTK